MSTVPFDLEQLAFDLDECGFAELEDAVATVANLARARGLGGVAADVLTDRTAPEVSRLRAFGAVATALAAVTDDRTAAPLLAVA